MKSRIITSVIVAVFGIGILAPSLASSDTAHAVNPKAKIKEGFKAAGDDVQDNPQNSLKSRIADIVNVLLFIIGTLAVIMLIIGGIRYTTSNGNPEQIKAAKNTIMYAVIGLIVALLAFAIVNFVVNSLAN
ncbi:hypothetical protein H6796_03250 [Candidatus Nomurabacteria bacterium]|nr:hypothetical protein [Candidatus Nomurabacteria bacterium]